MRIAGDSHIGKVRTTNEDALIVEPRTGLFAVLDGMGGASAGDVASQLARDTIRDFVLHRRVTLAPRELIEAAIVAASAAVHGEAQRHRDHHGMGTTVVACLVIDPQRVVIAHVGDSRAYLLREGRLQVLTRDHTIVSELVDRGLLTAEEAERHPYKNVLSRNLGAKPETRVDCLEVALRPGDRLLLCSDGLYGYAAGEAIQYLLGSGDAPAHVARDLIDLALRGGGGDNVTALVIEAPAASPSSTQVVRTTGALAWWQKRQRFLQVATDRGLTRNPIVRGCRRARRSRSSRCRCARRSITTSRSRPGSTCGRSRRTWRRAGSSAAANGARCARSSTSCARARGWWSTTSAGSMRGWGSCSTSRCRAR